MCVYTTLSAAFLLVFVLQADGSQADDECPGSNATVHKAFPYHFTYESWVQKRKDNNGYDFGRCVQTKNGIPLEVDWKSKNTDLNLKGWAMRDSPLLNVLRSPCSPTRDEQPVDADLWYGAAPEKIKAPFWAPHCELRVMTPLPAGREKPIMPLQSRVKMSIPRRVPQLTNLTKVDIRFYSEVRNYGENYEYEYMWQGSMPEPPDPHEKPIQSRKPIQFYWRSESVKKGIVRPLDRPLVASVELQKARFREKAGPEYAITAVEFLDESGEEVVAKASVAIYYPAGSKP